MNDTHQVLAYEEEVNLVVDHIMKIERYIDVSLNACKDIGLAVNTRELSTWKQDVIQANEHITVCSNSNEKYKNFKYLGSIADRQD